MQLCVCWYKCHSRPLRYKSVSYTHLDVYKRQIHYPVPPHLQQAYKEMNFKQGDFPLAEEIAETCLSLPIYPGLTNEQVEVICNTIKTFF